jgi:hypothetical protein
MAITLPYGNGLIAVFFARVFARRYLRKRRPDGSVPSHFISYITISSCTMSSALSAVVKSAWSAIIGLI